LHALGSIEHLINGRADQGMVDAAKRLSVLDGLRAASILLVLATHLLPLGPKNLQLNATTGAMGMSLFFALSGFLIASTLLSNPSVHDFIVRRLTRIIPLAYLYIAVLAGLAILDNSGAIWTASFLVNYASTHLTPATGHFWSLCVEMQYYAAIAVLVLILGKRGIWIVWPACAAITILRISDGSFIDIKTHLRVDEILAGACVATIYASHLAGARRFGTIGLGVAVLIWFATSHPASGWLQYARPYASASVLAGSLTLGDTFVRRILSSRPLGYVATISYSLYVIHPLTAYGWMGEGTVWTKYLLKRPITFVLTFGAAHISTFYWEQPWQRAGRWLIQKRRGTSNAEPVSALTA
jgi:peptidoglycan/LPS O-acetylase OafA/YrhL